MKSLRARLLAVFAVCIAGFAWSISVWALVAIVSDIGMKRVGASTARLDVLLQVSSQAATYRLGVERALSGSPTPDDSVSPARIAMERLFARLSQSTRAEITARIIFDDLSSQLRQIDSSRRLIELFHAIDAAANSARSLMREGRTSEAQAVLARDISFRIDNEFLPLLGQEQLNERRDSEAAIDRVVAAQWLISGVGGVGALAFLIALIVLTRRLYRDATVPLQHLTDTLTSDSDAASLPLPREFAHLQSAVGTLKQSAGEADAHSAGEVERLSAANAQLQAIDRRRIQILADVSHELRTPLTILRGEADVALRGEADLPTLRDSLERIQDQAAELGLLLDDLLALARSSQDAETYSVERVPVSDLLEAAVQEGSVLAASREIAITVDDSSKGAQVSVDFRRLRQALVIGIDNAVKQSPPGTTITLRADSDGGSAILSILDEGSGIADEDLPNVFARFFRGHGRDGSTRDGIGIGLSIARDIVERHGGNISLANREGRGAVLAISLPLVIGGVGP